MYDDWKAELELECKSILGYKATLRSCSAFVGLGKGDDGKLEVLTAAKVGVCCTVPLRPCTRRLHYASTAPPPALRLLRLHRPAACTTPAPPTWVPTAPLCVQGVMMEEAGTNSTPFSIKIKDLPNGLAQRAVTLAMLHCLASHCTRQPYDFNHHRTRMENSLNEWASVSVSGQGRGEGGGGCRHSEAKAVAAAGTQPALTLLQPLHPLPTLQLRKGILPHFQANFPYLVNNLPVFPHEQGAVAFGTEVGCAGDGAVGGTSAALVAAGDWWFQR